ncbi:MAG: aminoacyl-tRNA hydrolase [Paracoccus sp. (in: a-proteobacteria)]
MKLIVGLGNPGQKYAGNRHNIGFMAVDRIAADHGFSPWRSRFQGETAEGRLGSERAVLLKPGTFMNLSGQSVGEAMRYLKLEPSDVIIFHDELDLAPGKCRVKTGGGHAGHNGLRSMHQHIGEAYGRVRLGIGHPGHKDRVAGYVLSDFAKADGEWLDDLLRGISDGAEALAAGNGPGFQNAVARRVAPARNQGPAADDAQTVPRNGSTAKAMPAKTPKPEAATDQELPSLVSKLQSLAAKFR